MCIKWRKKSGPQQITTTTTTANDEVENEKNQ